MGDRGEDATRIFVSAGEASGDLHGSRLVRAVRDLAPSARITCLGGPALKEAGAEVLVENHDLAVVGISEVVRHLRVIAAAWRKIEAHLTKNRPQLVVLIDFPDFNFLLARLAARLGIRVFYYISPQIWAWRRGRVRTIKRLVHEMAVILPFEAEFYRQYGIDVHYVGHPLLDVMESAPSVEAARERYRMPGSGPVLGILPGSRRSEIRLLLPLLLETASRLSAQIQGISFLVPVAPTLDPGPIREAFEALRLPGRIVMGDTYGAVRACDLLVTVSGTATLEAAILGVPMIVVYRVSDLSYYLSRHLIKVKFAGLPNLIAGRGIVPEFIQHDANPERITAEAIDFLQNPGRLEEQRENLASIRTRLGAPGVAQRTARLVLEAIPR